MLDLLLISLSTWRLTSLLNAEDGPADIFKKVRTFFGMQRFEDISTEQGIQYFNDNPDVLDPPEYIHDGNFFAKVLECHWCLSIWVALLMTVLVKTLKIKSPSVVLAASAISIKVETIGD